MILREGPVDQENLSSLVGAYRERCTRLAEIMSGGSRLVIFLHDNPDPDSIAAGLMLLRIAEQLQVRAQMVYGGKLARAENRTLVKLLKIPLRSLERMRFRHHPSDRYALIDTQPKTGNNSFPLSLHAHIVVDHHPQRKNYTADFIDVRPEVGSTTTILLEYLEECGVKLDPTLATAAAYAISSETQDLEREAGRTDREYYQRLFPLVRQTILGRIRHPRRQRAYYQTIARAMKKVLVSKHTCVCHIGEVPHAEIVAEVADFLAAMERVSWCLVTGFCPPNMVLSLRSRRVRGNAERVMRRMLGKLGHGGGHGMMAGGLAPCERNEDYLNLATLVTERFFNSLSMKVGQRLQPLLEEGELKQNNSVVPPSSTKAS